MGLIVLQTEPWRTSSINRRRGAVFEDQGRPNFVATATTTKFETYGYCHLCLGHFYDLTLVATCSHASRASHTRAATTLGWWARSRSTRTEKCSVGRRDTTTATVTTIFVISGFSNRTCQSTDANGPSTYHIRRSRHPRNCSLVPVRTFCRR